MVQGSASTVVYAVSCKECGGSSICEHGRQRSQCKECGGASICEHGRIRSKCKECRGVKAKAEAELLDDVRGVQSRVTKLRARASLTVQGVRGHCEHGVVCARSARSAVGRYASTPSSAL